MAQLPAWHEGPPLEGGYGSDENWYLWVGDHPIGPLQLSQVRRLVQRGEVKPFSMLRYGEQGSWLEARNCEAIFRPTRAPLVRQGFPMPPAEEKPLFSKQAWFVLVSLPVATAILCLALIVWRMFDVREQTVAENANKLRNARHAAERWLDNPDVDLQGGKLVANQLTDAMQNVKGPEWNQAEAVISQVDKRIVELKREELFKNAGRAIAGSHFEDARAQLKEYLTKERIARKTEAEKYLKYLEIILSSRAAQEFLKNLTREDFEAFKNRKSLPVDDAIPPILAQALNNKLVEDLQNAIVLRDKSKSELVEEALYGGRLDEGERKLEAALDDDPGNDNLRFGLGMIQFVRAIEKLGQRLHRYGVKWERNLDVPFLRLPVPPNPHPDAITYSDFRAILQGMLEDLDKVDRTLSKIRTDELHVPIRFERIRLDLESNRNMKARFTSFMDIVDTVVKPNPNFRSRNPDFLVCFDRGDAAWLHGYSHSMMAVLEGFLALNTEPYFNSKAGDFFSNPQPGNPKHGFSLFQDALRLNSMRKHLVNAARLKQEMWRYIRAETDNDHEWLPNARQDNGAFGFRIEDAQIDAWLDAIGEVEKLLNGQKSYRVEGQDGVPAARGLNVKAFLDNPPVEKFETVLKKFQRGEFQKVGISDFFDSLPDRYYSDQPGIDLKKLRKIQSLLEEIPDFPYMMWFF